MKGPTTHQRHIAEGWRAVVGFGLLSLVALAEACSNTCSSGAICGDGVTVAPTSVVTTTTTNKPEESPTPDAGCVAQTAAFVCSKGAPLFEAILADTQRNVAPAPEPIYIVNLVKALNARPEKDVCAIAGPSPDEVTIKARASNALSATWDVVKADGTIQAITTPLNICVPSRF